MIGHTTVVFHFYKSRRGVLATTTKAVEWIVGAYFDIELKRQKDLVKWNEKQNNNLLLFMLWCKQLFFYSVLGFLIYLWVCRKRRH